jgi:hypothetical protein
VLGVPQKPMDGLSLLPSMATCEPDAARTQYFEIGGKVGLYHNGWFLSGDDGRAPWLAASNSKEAPDLGWTLYDLKQDFSQSTDVADQNPQKLQAMRAIWQTEATRNNVFPLDWRRATDRVDRSILGKPRKEYEFWGKDISLPATGTAPYVAGRSFTINADILLDTATSSGAIIAWGSKFGGWSLYLEEGRPMFVWAKSTDPAEMASIASATALPQGATKLQMRFGSAGPGKGAQVTLSSGGVDLATGSLPSNILSPAGGGETFDIGQDLGVTVTDYKTRHGRIEGDVPHVSIIFD